jgi:hypothetical protein
MKHPVLVDQIEDDDVSETRSSHWKTRNVQCCNWQVSHEHTT